MSSQIHFLYIGYTRFPYSISGVNKDHICKIGISHSPKTRVDTVLRSIPFTDKTIAFRYEHALHIHLHYYALGNEFFEMSNSQLATLLKCRNEQDLRALLEVEDNCEVNPVEIVVKRTGYDHYQGGVYSHHIPRHPRYYNKERL